MPRKQQARVGVFTRNHRDHLKRAVHRSDWDPHAPLVFQSLVRWASASEALQRQGAVPVYIAPIGGGGVVEFIGELAEVHLDPKPTEPRVAALLLVPPVVTPKEGLWGRTLYVLHNCRRLDEPFPMTELVKAADGLPLSGGYGYSYSVVIERR